MTPVGIGIGRETQVNFKAGSVANGAVTALVLADGNRVAVSFAVQFGAGSAVTDTCALGYVDNGVFVPIIVLSPGLGHAVIDVERYGQLAVVPLSYSAILTGVATFGLALVRPQRETTWDQS